MGHKQNSRSIFTWPSYCLANAHCSALVPLLRWPWWFLSPALLYAKRSLGTSLSIDLSWQGCTGKGSLPTAQQRNTFLCAAW